MSLYDMSDEDVAFVCSFAFEPQKVKGFLEKKKLVLAGEVKPPCNHPSAERVKCADISSPDFQHLQFQYKCIDCGEIVEPMIVGYKAKTYL